jgi:hypothetical protein
MRSWYISAYPFTPSHRPISIPQESQAEETSNKLSNLKKEEKNRAKKIQDMERAISMLQADLEKPVEVESMAAVDEEIVRLFTSWVVSFQLWDSVVLIKVTAAPMNANSISRNNKDVSLKMNPGPRPR